MRFSFPSLKKGLLFLVACSLPSLGKTGGSDAGNGGGIAEKRVLFAYQNFEKYLDLCLQTSLCLLDEKETILVKQMKSDLPREKAQAIQIEFVSGKTNPDFFKIDGQLRVAKTGDLVGSKIYINTDLLYWFDNAGNPGSTDLSTSVSILAHEFGHHHNIQDHTFLDKLGTKLQTFLLKQGDIVGSCG